MLLAIDTATRYVSIALRDATGLRGECTWEASQRHTVTLVPRIVALLEESNASPEELQAIAVCHGPGSYTGTRIGLAVAKGMAMARQIPLFAVSTLDILAWAQPPDPRLLIAVFSAGRRRIGYAPYRWRQNRWQAQAPVTLTDWNTLLTSLNEDCLLVGELDAEALAMLRPLSERIELPPAARHLRRAGYLADLAWARWQVGDQDDRLTLSPVYPA